MWTHEVALALLKRSVSWLLIGSIKSHTDLCVVSNEVVHDCTFNWLIGEPIAIGHRQFLLPFESHLPQLWNPYHLQWLSCGPSCPSIFKSNWRFRPIAVLGLDVTRCNAAAESGRSLKLWKHLRSNGGRADKTTLTVLRAITKLGGKWIFAAVRTLHVSAQYMGQTLAQLRYAAALQKVISLIVKAGVPCVIEGVDTSTGSGWFRHWFFDPCQMATKVQAWWSSTGSRYWSRQREWTASKREPPALGGEGSLKEKPSCSSRTKANEICDCWRAPKAHSRWQAV